MKTLTAVKEAFANGRRAINSLRVASAVANAETVTIGGEVYEVDTAAAPGSVVAGNFRVDCESAQTATAFCTALVASIKANSTRFDALKISANEVLVWTKADGAPFPCTETLAGANNAWISATMYGGADTTIRGRSLIRRAAVATEVTMGTMQFVFPWTVAAAIPILRAAAGTIKQWGGVLSLSGPVVTLTNNGTVDFADTDTFDVIASS
jgi:hypothetical protein